MESNDDSDEPGVGSDRSAAEDSPSLAVVPSIGRDVDIDELDRLLDLAGEIKEQIDRHIRRALFDFLILGLVIILIALLVSVLFEGPLRSKELASDGFFILVASLASAAGGATSITSLRRANNRLSLETRSLREVLDIAREVEQTMISNDQARPLTRARIRIRLSQFSLPPEKSVIPLVVRMFVSGS